VNQENKVEVPPDVLEATIKIRVDDAVSAERQRCLEIIKRYRETIAPAEIRRMIADGHVPVGFEPN